MFVAFCFTLYNQKKRTKEKMGYLLFSDVRIESAKRGEDQIEKAGFHRSIIES